MNDIIQYFLNYNIDINNDNILNINNILIPNFYKQEKNKNQILCFEFCHLLSRLFIISDFFNTGLTYYENQNLQINNQDIIFDCGANMGTFSAVAATKGQQVYSFEPISILRPYLQQTIKLYKNIYPIYRGLNNKNIITEIQINNNPSSSSLILLDNLNKTLYTELCNFITIDYFIQQTNIIPTFLKIHVEGMEWTVLEGAQICLQQYHPKITIALHGALPKNYQSLLPDYKIELIKYPKEEMILLGV